MYGRCAAPDLQKQQDQADAEQDMPDPGQTGDGRIRTRGERRPQHRGYTAHCQQHSGEVQPGMIDSQYPAGACSGKGKVFSNKSSRRKNTMPSKK